MITESVALDFNENVIPTVGYYDESYVDDEYDTVSYECAQFMIDLAIEEHNILQATILGDVTEILTESITAGLIIVITALAALITAVIAKVISIFTEGGSGGGSSRSELNKAQKALDNGDLEAAGNHLRKSAEIDNGNSKIITTSDVLISKFGKDIKYEKPICTCNVQEDKIGDAIDHDINFTGTIASLCKYLLYFVHILINTMIISH
jgi:hypothetical protein